MGASLTLSEAGTAASQLPAGPPAGPLILREADGTPGRPVVTITDAGLEAVALWAARGLGTAQIAKGLAISSRSFVELRKRDERVQEAIAYGNAVNASSLVDVLYAKALKGDTVSAIFLLKSRHNFRDQGPTTGDLNIRNLNILQIPAPMGMEAYKEHIMKRIEGGSV